VAEGAVTEGPVTEGPVTEVEAGAVAEVEAVVDGFGFGFAVELVVGDAGA
jgi:hypothetical protein